jgi:hypothetical protein
MVGVGHSIPLLKNSTISTRQLFAQGLADIEFVEERNIHIEYRWAEGQLRPQAVRLRGQSTRAADIARGPTLTLSGLREHSRDLRMGATDHAMEAWYDPSIA